MDTPSSSSQHDASDPLTYFSELAEVYQRYRPDYPEAAIHAIIDGMPRPITAADVGSGTGISSRALAVAGVRVIGIEPNDGMRRAAEQQTVRDEVYRVGTSDTTGLGDDAVDLVVCAQSFHWFDVKKTLAEFKRILRPGGRVALMWNVSDGPATGFTAEYHAVRDAAMDDAESRGLEVHRVRTFTAGEFGPGYEHRREVSVDNTEWYSLDDAIGRICSASYFPADGAPLRDELLDRLRVAHAAHVREDGRAEYAQQVDIVMADTVAELLSEDHA